MTAKKATLKQIARLANVSVATVSYVMNGRDIVSKVTKEKVLAIANQLNYTPDIMAQSLRTQNSKLVFALVNTLSSVFNTSILSEIEEDFEQRGYQLLVLQGELPAVLKTNIFDGGIILNRDFPTDQLETLTDLFQNKIILLSDIDRLNNSNVVQMDNTLGMELAVSEIYKSRHQRVCFIQGLPTSANDIERYSSAEKAYQQLYQRDDFQIRIFDAHFITENAYSIAKHLLENQLYDAFVCFNDGMALGVYQAAADLNLTVGKDISVIGFDNSFFAKHLTPALTTINIDKKLWAHEIVNSYLTVSQPNHQQKITVPTTLMQRHSIAFAKPN
ncbi:LacI family DNA-binding transcriptional regulator [Lapidilactobacillus bayanensis]|uniref:LacI family DNA-binding transcriptional regulator n=1 Tax=Lapidilactobacillus bayanensis TaxID=2485998 RepID=UPI000F767398|nr:LacI family DNA-binding transcriptional regulator [Lapidilactobacillus bayanensis]